MNRTERTAGGGLLERSRTVCRTVVSQSVAVRPSSPLVDASCTFIRRKFTKGRGGCVWGKGKGERESLREGKED